MKDLIWLAVGLGAIYLLAMPTKKVVMPDAKPTSEIEDDMKTYEITGKAKLFPPKILKDYDSETYSTISRGRNRYQFKVV